MARANFQLMLQTLNLILGFMVWVILSSLISFIQNDIQINPSELAIVTAVPVILGSILKVKSVLDKSVWGEMGFFNQLIVFNPAGFLYQQGKVFY